MKGAIWNKSPIWDADVKCFLDIIFQNASSLHRIFYFTIVTENNNIIIIPTVRRIFLSYSARTTTNQVGVALYMFTNLTVINKFSTRACA